MDILGIGIPELFFVILIAIIVLGPKDMQKTGKTIGRWMRKIVMSPEWREIKDASNKIKSIPNQLMREANLEDFKQYKRDLDITSPGVDKTEKAAGYGAWDGSSRPKEVEAANSIAPPTNTQNEAQGADENPAPAQKTDSSKETPPTNPLDTNHA